MSNEPEQLTVKEAIEQGYKLYNAITGGIVVKLKDGKLKDIAPGRYSSRSDRIFIGCKENDAIVAVLNKKREEIEKIKMETSCSSGKLIPCKQEHFV